MYIKYEDAGDRVLLHVPRDCFWTLKFQMFDEDGCEDYSVSLCPDGKEPIRILEADWLCQGNPGLPCYAVGHLYEELIDKVAGYIENHSDANLLDIPRFVKELLHEKYEGLWRAKGYLSPDWVG